MGRSARATSAEEPPRPRQHREDDADDRRNSCRRLMVHEEVDGDEHDPGDAERDDSHDWSLPRERDPFGTDFRSGG